MERDDGLSATNNLPILLAIVGMSIVALGAIVIVSATMDATQAGSIIGHILTITIPTTASLASYLKATQATGAIREVHTQINSRMDQLLLLTASESKAEGKVEQRTEQTARDVAGKPAKDASYEARVKAGVVEGIAAEHAIKSTVEKAVQDATPPQVDDRKITETVEREVVEKVVPEKPAEGKE